MDKLSKPHGATPLPGAESAPIEELAPETETANDPEQSNWDDLGATRVVNDNEAPRSTKLASGDTEVAKTSERAATDATLGDFRILQKVGEGAMGTVYKARQISFKRDVALKILFPHISKIPKLVERLNREAEVMGQLDHPNIVQAYVVDEVQGQHFVAMEYVRGDSLQKWLQRAHHLSVGDAIHITLACARALGYAHNLGVIHRDIKPDNILIARDGNVKVADLGMVKRMDEDLGLTQTGHAVGTPWYMPLEQARNAKDTDRRCDIYALGCMLYCLLTGAPPLPGKLWSK